jgi:hypothetical protein
MGARRLIIDADEDDDDGSVAMNSDWPLDGTWPAFQVMVLVAPVPGRDTSGVEGNLIIWNHASAKIAFYLSSRCCQSSHYAGSSHPRMG